MQLSKCEKIIPLILLDQLYRNWYGVKCNVWVGYHHRKFYARCKIYLQSNFFILFLGRHKPCSTQIDANNKYEYTDWFRNTTMKRRLSKDITGILILMQNIGIALSFAKGVNPSFRIPYITSKCHEFASPCKVGSGRWLTHTLAAELNKILLWLIEKWDASCQKSYLNIFQTFIYWLNCRGIFYKLDRRDL